MKQFLLIFILLFGSTYWISPELGDWSCIKLIQLLSHSQLALLWHFSEFCKCPIIVHTSKWLAVLLQKDITSSESLRQKSLWIWCNISTLSLKITFNTDLFQAKQKKTPSKNYLEGKLLHSQWPQYGSIGSVFWNLLKLGMKSSLAIHFFQTSIKKSDNSNRKGCVFNG